MTREIKFRAWDKQCKMMIQNESEWFEKEHIGKQISDNKIVVPAWKTNKAFVIYYKENLSKYDVEAVEIENVELMQYTGLKDKNGKEIYEGDILKSDLDEVMIDTVEWDADLVSFHLKNVSTGFSRIRIEDWEWEVIGNIYENPELLK